MAGYDNQLPLGITVLRRGAAILIGLVTLVGWSAPHAYAGDGQDCAPVTTCDAEGHCTTKMVCTGSDPGTPGTPGTPGDDNPGHSVCMFQGKEVDCSKNGFWYSNGCYFKADASIDPKNFNYLPNWQPGGTVYWYYCLPSGEGSVEQTWMLNPPPGYGGPGVNPRDLADQAIKQMNLSAVTIGIVPKPGKNSMGLVGMPAWMWAASPTDNTTGPISITVSAGGVSVTATGTLDHVDWNMGDGTTVTCSGANAKGTPYDASYGRQDSPTCGHHYSKTSGDQPNNEYTVTATSYWVVNWSGGGQSGTINVPALSANAQIRVGEVQVLEQH